MLRMEIRMETEIPTPETQEVLEPTIEDMIQAEDGVPFTTSLAIAQAFEKEHKNVLRDIQNLECSPKFLELNFELYEYSRDLGIGVREYPAYRLTRDGFAFLAMGFTGKKAAAWKESFNAMEAALLKQQRQKEAERLERQRQKELTEQKNLEQQEQPAPRSWEKPEEFRSARKLTRNQTEALMGLLNMECLLQDHQPEDALKELLAFFHIASLEDMCQSDYRNAVFSVAKRMFLSSKNTENGQTSPRYTAAINGLASFWNHSSDFTRGDIQTYIKNKCGISLQEGIASDLDGLKVLFALWGGISHYGIKI